MENMIEIPRELGGRLLKLVEDLTPYLSTEEEELAQSVPSGDWTPGMIKRFRVRLQALPGAVALLTHAAVRPDEEVTYRDVLDAIGLDDRTMRVQLAQMSKLSRELFGRVTWPLKAWQASDGVMRYEMPRDIARWWLDESLDSHWGKYRPLWAWLRAQERDAVRTTFSEIEEILGFALPPSSRKHKPHWHSYEGSAVVRAIQDAGWQARRVDLELETLVLFRQERRGR